MTLPYFSISKQDKYKKWIGILSQYRDIIEGYKGLLGMAGMVFDWAFDVEVIWTLEKVDSNNRVIKQIVRFANRWLDVEEAIKLIG